jgi:pimeloyl-ACP methyl ester carboxylesterase
MRLCRKNFFARMAGSFYFFAILIGPSYGNDAPKRPLVVVPGILGSKLCNGSEVVWGNRSSLSNFSRLDLAASTSEVLAPCGLLDQVSVLGSFWKIDAYGGLIEKLKSLGYEEGKTLFVFDYDWRRSNFDTAGLLAKYLAKIGAPEVDIVAHSMGGLVTSIMIHESGARVHKVLFLGTPFLGSMNVFGMLSNGWGGFENLIAGGIDTIRRTALSLPSLYELLPSYANCCRLGSATDYIAIDPMNPQSWRKYRWLPIEYDTGPRAGYFDASLSRARQAQEIVKEKLPDSIGVVRVVSDVFATNYYFVAPSDDPSWKSWKFVKARGDQTVPAWSAASNLLSLASTSPSFSVHGTIFNDRTVQSIIERELLDLAAPRQAPLRLLTTTSGAPKTFEYVDVEFEPNTIPVGQRTFLRFDVNWGQATSRGEIVPHAFLLGPEGKIEIPLVEVTTDADLASNTLTFRGAVNAPMQEGSWPVVLDFLEFDGEYSAVLTSFVPK